MLRKTSLPSKALWGDTLPAIFTSIPPPQDVSWKASPVLCSKRLINSDGILPQNLVFQYLYILLEKENYADT